VPTEPIVVEIACEEIRREMVNYAEGDLTPELAQRIQLHLANCRPCVAVYDGAKNVLNLVGDGSFFQLPEGFSQRLRQRFAAATQAE
jgi:predicted anti-sigma-YlaC factor YlaD